MVAECYVCGAVLTQRDTQTSKQENNQYAREFIKGKLFDGRIINYCQVCWKSFQEGLKIYRLCQVLQKK